MSVSASIPVTVQMRRSRFLGLIVVVAALATAGTWAVFALAFDNGTEETASNARTSVAVPAASVAQDAGRAPSIMSMTPAQLAGLGLGTGYALPSAQSGPTAASVLASMSPQTRRYTERIMNLTFEQLAAGAAGSP
jgi:hypothetical protein